MTPGAWMVMSKVCCITPVGQHVHHQLRRHGADADLAAGHLLAVGADQAVGHDGQRQLLLLLGRQVRGRDRLDGERGRLGVADGRRIDDATRGR